MLYPPTNGSSSSRMLRGGMNGAASHLQLKKAGAKLTIKPLKSQPQLPTDFEEVCAVTCLCRGHRHRRAAPQGLGGRAVRVPRTFAACAAPPRIS